MNGQHLLNRQVHLDQGAGISRLARQFIAENLHEHDTFVGEIAVKRRLGHARLTGDIIHCSAFEPVPQENRPGTLQNLKKLTPARYRKSLRHP
jgi:hypothetical protein